MRKIDSIVKNRNRAPLRWRAHAHTDGWSAKIQFYVFYIIFSESKSDEKLLKLNVSSANLFRQTPNIQIKNTNCDATENLNLRITLVVLSEDQL